MKCALRGSYEMTADDFLQEADNDDGVISLHDESFDDTVVDLSDCDQITLTQIDEQGRTHTVILSAQHVAQIFPHLEQWKTNHSPPIFLVPSPLN